MQRTASSLRTDSSARIADLERRRPEWRAWLELLVASRESRVAGRVASREWRDASAPLLTGCTVEVDSAQVCGLLDRLISIAAVGDLEGAVSLRRYRPSKIESVDLLSAAVRQDGDRLTLLADRAGVDRGALASIAHLAAIPLLYSCGEQLQEHVPEYWPQGYCPVCAAWPTLAERRGLDRTRRLRCGRCASEWEMQWLCCCYCGERDHEKLGSLVPDEGGEKLKVETCDTCHGYLKSLATLQAIPPSELLLRDLETVELDLVAREQGYGRPEACAFVLDVRIA